MRSFRSKPVGWENDNYRHYLAAKFGSAGKKYFTQNWLLTEVKKGGKGKSFQKWVYKKLPGNETSRNEEFLTSLSLRPAQDLYEDAPPNSIQVGVPKPTKEGEQPEYVYGVIAPWKAPVKATKIKTIPVVKPLKKTTGFRPTDDDRYSMFEQELVRRQENRWMKKGEFTPVATDLAAKEESSERKNAKTASKSSEKRPLKKISTVSNAASIKRFNKAMKVPM